MQDDHRDSFYRIAWRLSGCFYDLFFPVEGHGQENLPRAGGFIIASNHLSYLDPPAIGVSVDRDLAYFARKSLFNPPFDRLLRRVHAIPVDRDSGSDIAAMKGALQCLRQGLPLVLFPEGTRSPDGQLLPGKRGIGLLAAKAGVPVVPCRVFGTLEAWGRDRRPRPGTPLSVRFGAPLSAEKIAAGVREHGKQRAADMIMEAIAGIPPPSPAYPV